MAVLGTFGSFGIARLAIYASSASLSVTGNNIANINTDGYCRQYLKTSSMFVGGTDQYASGGSLNFGTGVSSDAIFQYRDIYMDIRYRDENTNVGEAETKLSGLTDLAFILDEVASGNADFGVIEAQFSTIVEMLQSLSEKTGSEEYDTLVRSACETLVQLFNTYADKLETVADNTLAEFTAEVDNTNLLLTNIRDLNEQIRNAEIYGDLALALRDQRNLYVDELSSLVGIDVVYSSEDIGLGLSVENMTISIAGTDIELVNGIYCTQFNLDEFTNMINPNVDSNGTAYFDSSLVSNYMYVDENNNPTNDPDLATAWLNPDYPYEDGHELADCRWLSPTGTPVSDARLAGPQVNKNYWGYSSDDPTAVLSSVGLIEDPDNEGEYIIDTDWMYGQYAVGIWDPDANDGEGDWLKNDDGSYYVDYTTNDPNYTYTYTYVDEDGIEQTVEGSIIQLNNNVDGDYDNCYLFTLSPMESAKGKYMTDQYNRDITAEIYLSDTVLSGSLQAFRELLTEEGEYSSALDVAMDEDATVKRGIPYYRMALDSLAQKFADTFNTINNLNLEDIFSMDDDGVFMDKNSLLGGIVQLDANGNIMYEPLKIDGVPVTQNNLDTIIDSTDPDLSDYNGMTFGDYLFNNGVRDANYLMNDTGCYLMEEYNEEGVLCYVPIETADGVYLTAETLNSDTLHLLEENGIIQDIYNPEEMFTTGSYTVEDVSYQALLDVNGQMFSYTDPDGGTHWVTVEAMMDDTFPYANEMFQYAMDKGVLTSEYSNFQKSGNLFSNNSNGNDGTGITASTISISRDWSIGNVRIVTAKGEDPGSTDNSNVLKFINAMDADMQYKATDIAADAWTGKNEFFNGSFQGILTNTASILAQDMQTTTTLLQNYETSALSLDNYRLSVSGVDLNEEATNMMQYQKSYVAAAKLMTTLDEVIEVLLNM